ncbi:MAG: type III pantothenate kinase [Mogibacterium sp.]|nr:type III pantothenate kinase [Mogibacterium sp.]
MLLAIDVGNTNVVLGVYNGRKLIESWRMATDNKRSADEYGTIIDMMMRHDGIDPADIDDIIVSTVVPSLLFTLEHMCLKFYNKNPIVVETGIKTGLKIKYDDPRQVGSDRIVNSVAAHSRYGGNLIVVDFGTATTLSCVTADGCFLGGAIAPGMKTQAAALFEHTAKLPNVDLEFPGRFICKNTSEGMQSGLIYGHMGFIEHMITGMKREMAIEAGCSTSDIRVIATGGMATMVESGVSCIDVIDRRLTLDGLQMLYEKNVGLNKKRVLQEQWESE